MTTPPPRQTAPLPYDEAPIDDMALHIEKQRLDLLCSLTMDAFETWYTACLAQKRGVPISHNTYAMLPAADRALLMDIVESVLDALVVRIQSNDDSVWWI